MKIWEKFRYAVFDVDGTILDNMTGSTEAFVHILSSEGFGIPNNEAEEFYLETTGMPVDEQFRIILKNKGTASEEKLIEKMEKNFFEHRDKLRQFKEAKVFEGIPNILKLLKDNGIKIFLTSGSQTKGIEEALRKRGLLEYVDCIMGSDNIPKGRKHMEVFSKEAEVSFETFANNAFYLGDGAHDMRIAKEAGIFAIGITNTVDETMLMRAGADRIIKKSGDLLEIIV